MNRFGAWIGLAAIVGALALFLHVGRGVATDAKWNESELVVPLPSSDTPMTLTHSAQCAECHSEVYEEWRGSHHAISFTNPEVQRISNNFQNRDCLPCHLPRPIYETGIGIRPLERRTREADGVDCMTCHFHPGGNVMIGAGPLTAAASDAPCQPRVHPSISDTKSCSPCHNQHKVHDDWAQTRFAVKGSPEYRDCKDCHMPEVERVLADGTIEIGRSHRFPGAHDAEFLRQAVTLSAELSARRKLAVSVENTNTGHHFPADERHRAADLHLELTAADGRKVEMRVARYRNPYREEYEIKNPLREPGATYEESLSFAGIGEVRVQATRRAAAFQPIRVNPYPESTQIPSGEARDYDLTLPPGVTGARVRLWFRTTPIEPDAEAVLVDEHQLTLDG